MSRLHTLSRTPTSFTIAAFTAETIRSSPAPTSIPSQAVCCVELLGHQGRNRHSASGLVGQPAVPISGWFQSEKYFAANLQQVRAWFRPKAEVERRVEEAMARWPRPPEAMAALHVRRGDYGIIRDAMGDGERGWLLPMTYYREALARIPNDVSLVIFS